MSTVLETAIGLAAVYLMLSLVCTVVMEWMARVTQLRGSTLVEGVKNLVNDPAHIGLAGFLFNHGMIASLSQNAANPRQSNRLPSYIPGGSFSASLIDILASEGAVLGSVLTKLNLHSDSNDTPEMAAEKLQRKQRLVAALAKIKESQSKAKAEGKDRPTFSIPGGLGDILEGDWTTLSESEAVKSLLASYWRLDHKLQSQTLLGLFRTSFLTPFVSLKNWVKSFSEGSHPSTSNDTANEIEKSLKAGREALVDAKATFEAIQQGVSLLPDGHTKSSLSVLLQQVRSEVASDEARLKSFRTGLESWFDEAMDRVGGWYKRQSQSILLCVSIFVVLLTNADTIRIAARLQKDHGLRTAMITWGQQMAASNVTVSNTTVGDPNASPPNSTVNTTTTVSPPNRVPSLDQVLNDSKDLALPLGYKQNPFFTIWQAVKDGQFLMIGLKALGFLLTVIAISLGAPFWFDALTSITNIRAAGQKPEKEAKKTPKAV